MLRQYSKYLSRSDFPFQELFAYKYSNRKVDLLFQWDRYFPCNKRKDARPFFEKGRIKFGTPRSWVEWEKEHGNGRGDQFEGTLATFNIFDVEHRLYL